MPRGRVLHAVRMHTIPISIVAACFALTGTFALVRPETILALVGVATLERDGRNEVRAVYGGFGIAVAALLGAATVVDSIRLGALVSVAAALGGMIAGRLVSLVTDGLPGFYPRVFLIAEVAFVGLLVRAITLAT